MVQHRADRLLPVVVEGQTSQRPSASLAGALERDDVEPGFGDTLPDGVELLDQRVEPAVQEHRSSRGRSHSRQHVGRQRGAGVGNFVANQAVAGEPDVEQVSVAPIAIHLRGRPWRGEELSHA
jgi:hypothetical protein